MAEITVPDQRMIVDKVWTLDVPAQANKSGWTSDTKIIGLPGAESWSLKARVRFRSTIAQQRPWRSFFTKLRGIQNTFRVQVACNQRTGSNPTVGSGAGNGYSIPLTGFPASTTVLREGDYITVPLPSGHHRLVMLSADLVSNGAGVAVAQFNPALRETPALGTVVETINPYTLVRQVSKAAEFANGDYSIEAEEAL